MSVRQYIGARYVPRFVGTWNNTTQYEALDVVDNGSGTSYIARKNVPAGTPLNNSEYWFLYGASSGAIVDLQNRMSTAENDIDDLSNNKADARKAIYLGNSYAIGFGSESGNGLYALTKDLYDDSRLYYDGGVGFLQYTGHTVTFETLLNRAIMDPDGLAHAEVTDIVILSAWGDTLALKAGGSASYTNFEAAMVSLVTAVKTNYPNVKRIMLSLVETRSHRSIPGTSEGTSYYNEPFECHSILNILAPRNGIEYIGWTGFEAFMIGDAYTAADHYHPSASGNKIIASALKSAINGGYQYRPLLVRGRFPCAVLPSSTVFIEALVTPNESVINFGSVQMGAGNSIGQYDTAALVDTTSVSETAPAVPAPLHGRTSVEMGLIDLITTPPDHTKDLMLYCALKGNNGVAYISAQSFNTAVTVTAKNNGGLNIHSYAISNSP